MVSENSENGKQNKDSKTTSKRDCLDCEEYRRKVQEVEQTASARNVLIDMLQKEVQKFQNLYRTQIDDFEKLRFVHCSTVQDFSNLKEIYKKLDEENRKLIGEKKRSSSTQEEIKNLQVEVENWKKQYEELQKDPKSTKQICDCTNPKEVIDEIMNIEKIIQNENQSIKLLLMKFLDELKNPKAEIMVEKEKTKVPGCCRAIKNKNPNKEDLIQEIDNLKRENSDLNNLVEKLKEENMNIKNNLNEKKLNLSKCILVLDKNYTDINNLSESIEGIIKEKDKSLQEVETLKKVIEENEAELAKNDRLICELKCKVDSLVEKLDEANKTNETSESSPEQETSENQNRHIQDQLKEIIETNEEKLKQKDLQIEQLEKKLNGETSFKDEITQTEKETLEADKKDDEDDDDDDDDESNTSAEDLGPKHSDKDNKSLQKELNKYRSRSEELQKELRKHSDYRFKSEIHIAHLENSNEALSETIEVVNQENKSNCKTIEDLNKSLKEANAEHEARDLQMQKEIQKLTDELEEHKIKLKQLEGNSKEKVRSMSDQIEEADTLRQRIESLQSELSEAHLEMDEYEEENKFYSQKIETMEKEMGALQEAKLRTDDDNIECCENMKKLRTEFHIKLNEKDETINDLKEEVQVMLKLKEHHEVDGGKDGEDFRKKIDELEQEKAGIQTENIELRKQVNKYQEELEEISGNTENKILLLQHKIDSLENQNKAKEDKLANCCEQMKGIQRTLGEKTSLEDENIKLKNENLQRAEQLENLKKIIDELKERYESFEKADAETSVDTYGEEFEQKISDLTGTISKKESTIRHLEECIDKSSRVLTECEKEIKELHSQNETLRNDMESAKLYSDQLAYEVEEHKADKDNLQQNVNRTRRLSEEIQKDNERLFKNLQDQKHIEEKIAKLTKDYNELLEESKEKDNELDKIKKQFEILQTCCKSPNISKEEFQKLKKVSKEIKALLTAQMNKINVGETCVTKDGTTKSKPGSGAETNSLPCLNKYIAELEGKLRQKEAEVKTLQNENYALSLEVSNMKRYVHMIVVDNNNLKAAIVTLLHTVITKLKTICQSDEDISNAPSANKIADDVLKSLVNITECITENFSTDACPIPKCNCMSVIRANYHIAKDDPLLKNPTACKNRCKKGTDDLARFNNITVGSSCEIVDICQICCGQKGVQNQDVEDELDDDEENYDKCVKGCRGR